MHQLVQKHAAKLRFGLVGGLNTLIDFSILFILASLFGVPNLIANSVAVLVAFSFSFFANKKFTFRSKSNQHVVREAVLFTVFTLFGLLVIQNIIIALLVPMFGRLDISDDMSLLISKLVATVASLIWNYLLYSKVVFKSPSEK